MTTGHPTDDLAAYAIGALDPDEAADVGAHLAGCQPCRSEVAAFSEVAWDIAALAPLPASASDVRARVVERARRGGTTLPAAAPTGFADRLRGLLGLRVPLALPLALAVLLAVALAGLGSARQDADAYAQAVSGVASGTVVPLVPSAGSDVRGALVTPERGEPYLLLRVPAPPPGKTWEAWVIRSDRPIPAGITGDRSGVLTLLLSERVRPGDTVALTLEDAGGVASPRGAVVLQARL